MSYKAKYESKSSEFYDEHIGRIESRYQSKMDMDKLENERAITLLETKHQNEVDKLASHIEDYKERVKWTEDNYDRQLQRANEMSDYAKELQVQLDRSERNVRKLFFLVLGMFIALSISIALSI